MDKGYYVIEYTNDYAECDELRYVYDTYDAAETYADDTVENYGADCSAPQYRHIELA